MLNKRNIFILVLVFSCIGCETMNKGAYKAGEGVGKATKVADSVSEGAVDGYMGAESPEDNPYGR